MMTQVEAAQKSYGALAKTYDNETRFIVGIRKQAIAALDLRPGETVLDAGCGTGWCLPLLSRHVGRQGKVIGFEPTAQMLSIAESRVHAQNLVNIRLLRACGNSVTLNSVPDAIIFSYTHDLVRSQTALAHIFSQARAGTRIVAVGTRLFPKWFFVGNWYLRYTHRVTITNFEGLDRPWTVLADFCREHRVNVKAPGSRYIFIGTLA